ncbi:hypothetical protein ACHAWF_001964, partial [Thalassiosira exigua]
SCRDLEYVAQLDDLAPWTVDDLIANIQRTAADAAFRSGKCRSREDAAKYYEIVGCLAGGEAGVDMADVLSERLGVMSNGAKGDFANRRDKKVQVSRERERRRYRFASPPLDLALLANGEREEGVRGTSDGGAAKNDRGSAGILRPRPALRFREGGFFAFVAFVRLREREREQELVRAAGMRAVRQARGETWEEVVDFLKAETFPVVLKPTDSAGSDGVKLCHTLDEAKEHFRHLLQVEAVNGGYNTRVLCQEFLRGKEYVVDHVSQDGVHKTMMCWVYDKRPRNGSQFVYFGMLPIDPESEEAKVLIPYTRGVLDALGMAHGPSHGEIIITADGPCLVEMNDGSPPAVERTRLRVHARGGRIFFSHFAKTIPQIVIGAFGFEATTRVTVSHDAQGRAVSSRRGLRSL